MRCSLPVYSSLSTSNSLQTFFYPIIYYKRSFEYTYLIEMDHMHHNMDMGHGGMDHGGHGGMDHGDMDMGQCNMNVSAHVPQTRYLGR